jgi:RNA polymerase-binding transcription factor DksA
MDTQELRADLDQIVREADALVAAREAEQDDETEDADANESETDREEALIDAAVERRTEALAAIERLEAGTYGVCVDCGDRINEERLAFRPEASRCLPCQEKFEAL